MQDARGKKEEAATDHDAAGGGLTLLILFDAFVLSIVHRRRILSLLQFRVPRSLRSFIGSIDSMSRSRESESVSEDGRRLPTLISSLSRASVSSSEASLFASSVSTSLHANASSNVWPALQ